MMAAMAGYAQPLRAIGQALEILKVQGFEMEQVGDDFVVRGSVRVAQRKLLIGQCSAEQLRLIWGSTPQDEIKESRRWLTNPNNLSRIELCYRIEDVERLDVEGRSRRGRGQTIDDAWSLSQILRSIGAYLNQKCARLCKIVRDDDSVSVEYETTVGTRIKETLAMRDLYDLWVRMYLHRADRPTH
jgi:hypothetical protein